MCFAVTKMARHHVWHLFAQENPPSRWSYQEDQLNATEA